MHASSRRLVSVAAVGLAVGSASALVAPWQLAVLAGWNAATVVYLTVVWAVIGRADGTATKHGSIVEDDSRSMRGLIVVAAGVASLAGAAAALHKSGRVDSTVQSVLLVVIAVTTVIASWLSVHTDFTLRYAHLYYTPPEGGVDFQGTELPSYRDFAYLAFTIGMTYQVSDTGLLTPRFRRELLKHALLSYLFGTIIIASVINAVAGLV